MAILRRGVYTTRIHPRCPHPSPLSTRSHLHPHTPLSTHPCPNACWDTPPPMDRMTHTCENSSFASQSINFLLNLLQCSYSAWEYQKQFRDTCGVNVLTVEVSVISHLTTFIKNKDKIDYIDLQIHCWYICKTVFHDC